MTKAVAVIATLAVIVASVDSADAGWRRRCCRGYSNRCCAQQYYAPSYNTGCNTGCQAAYTGYAAPAYTGCAPAYTNCAPVSYSGCAPVQYGAQPYGQHLDAYGNPTNAPQPADNFNAPRPAPQEDFTPAPQDGAPQPAT